MMHEVYVYDSGQNYDGLGLVGALSAISCIHDEVGGGDSEVTLEHPFDELGKWTALTEGRHLKCWVPVRETPKLKMDGTDSTQTITREVYRVKTNGGRLRLRKSPNTSAKILGRYNPGAEVVKLLDAGTASGHDWYQVSVVNDGSTGYMAATYLEYVRSYTESAAGDVTLESSDTAGQANWVVRPQIFEIYRRALTDDGVVVHARHISYKLLKNATTYAPSGAVTMQQSLNGILDNCETPHDFRAYTDINETRDGISWKLINPIKAMLDKENGALAKWNAQLIRDNWDLFFIRRAGRNRGIRVEYGKNLAGVNYSEDTLNTATRILPVGQNKDGTELFLPERYVDSPRIAEYDEPMIYPLKCFDCKVGNNLTKEAAYDKMRKQAQELLDSGCDLPTVSVKVDFISLGDTEEYAQFRALDKLFLYDEIQLVAIRGYLNISAQVVSLSWDCLHDRAVGLEIGTVGVSLSGSKLASWQIPGGISGSKITDGSIGAAQLGADIISARHMQANSINTDALQAGIVTAEKIAAGAINAMAIEALRAHINELVAGSVTTDQLYADLAFIAAAQITTANIKEANIDWAQIATLTAQVATIAKAEIERGDIQWAQIGTLNAAVAAIAQAQITTANIKNADIDWAEIEKLNAQTAIVAKAEIEKGNIQWAEIATLNAAVANIAQAQIARAQITSAQISDLQAAVAKIFSASIGNADIGFAQIKDLIAQRAIITEGVGGQLYIARLAVTEANMVSLSVGELMVKGADGRFYTVGVDENGNVKTTLKQVENSDIADRTIHGTEKLIEGSITAQVLNAQSIFGDSAIIRKLIAANLDVDTLFAREATIAALNAVDIRGNEYLKLSVEGKSTVYRGAKPPAGGNANDLFIQSATGYTFQRVDGSDALPEFAIDDEGVLWYSYKEGQTPYALYMDEYGNLHIEDNKLLTLAIGADGTPEWWQRVKDSELEREAQDALAAAEAAQAAANQNAADMASIVTRFSEEIAGIQDQLDGNVTSWFITGEPTNDNYPANEWTTDELKNVHLGDLCYDGDTGYCYRWQLVNGVYGWVRIADTDVTKALADAAKAQDTADSKRRVFVTEPIPPYDVGDIWVQGGAGDIMRCQIAKTDGQGYAASDWVKASKYTDDTVANAALNKANQNAEIITEHEAAITTNKRNIELRVTQKVFDESVSGLRQSIQEAEAKIDVKAEEITSSVSKTYATKEALSETNSNVNLAKNAAGTAQKTADEAQGTANKNASSINVLVERVDSAEQKITPESIVSTVRSDAAYKADLDGKASAEAVEKQQTEIKMLSDSVALKVNETVYRKDVEELRKSLEDANEAVDTKNGVFSGEQPPVNGKPNDLFVQSATGYIFQRIDSGDGLPEFAIDEHGDLYYRYPAGATEYPLYMDDNGELYIEDNPYLTLAVSPEGFPEWWRRVKDSELEAAIELNRQNIELRVTADVLNQTVEGLEKDISEAESRINLRADSIESSVKTLYDRTDKAESSIKQNADQIALKVSQTVYDKEKDYSGTTPPEDPETGKRWLDTSALPPIMKMWNGAEWLAVGAQEVKSSNVTINDDNVTITTEDFLLQLLDPEDNENVLMEMRANGNVGFNRLNAVEVISSSVAQVYTGPKNLYVDPFYTGDAPEYFRSLADAMQTINYKYLRDKVNISLFYANEVYDYGGVTIAGVFGPGELVIYGAGKTLNSYLTITGCFARVRIYSMYIRECRGEEARVPRLIDISDCRNVVFSDCTFDGNEVSRQIVYQAASDTGFTLCGFYNASTGIQAERGAVMISNCKGSLNSALVAVAASIYAGGTIPGGKLTTVTNGQIYSEGTTVDYGTAVPPIPPEATAVFTADTTRSWRGSWRNDTQDVIQGVYSENGYSSSLNWQRGGMWFSALKSTLTGKTVKSTTITLKRLKAGTYSPKNMYLCALKNTAPSGALEVAAEFGTLGAIDVNEQLTFSVPAAAVQGLADGTYGALALYEPPQNFGKRKYSECYMRVCGADTEFAPILTVIYS